MTRPARQSAGPEPTPKRQVPSCPWCGAGSDLGIMGDGFGAVALACKRCGARGPCVPLGGDLNASDEAAITIWSRRSRPLTPPGLVERVRIAIGLRRATGSLSPDSSISVTFSDLELLLRAVGA